MAIVSPLPIYTPELTTPFSTSKVDLTRPTEPNKGTTMTETLDRISAHNLWAAGTLEDDNPWVRDAVTGLALDPVNLAEYPAVTDLRFVGTM